MSGGYKSLLVYRLALTIDDFTALFCERFLADSRYRRTVEQMTQATRSGKQHIAEASKELSSSSDLLLNSVSRSSYTELAEDFEDFLRHKGLPIWSKDDPRVMRIRSFRESIEVSTNLSNLTNWTNLDFNNAENFANLMICLCYKQGYLMDQFLRSKEKKFIAEGGFREQLFRKRSEYRKKTKFD